MYLVANVSVSFTRKSECKIEVNFKVDYYNEEKNSELKHIEFKYDLNRFCWTQEDCITDEEELVDMLMESFDEESEEDNIWGWGFDTGMDVDDCARTIILHNVSINEGGKGYNCPAGEKDNSDCSVENISIESYLDETIDCIDETIDCIDKSGDVLLDDICSNKDSDLNFDRAAFNTKLKDLVSDLEDETYGLGFIRYRLIDMVEELDNVLECGTLSMNSFNLELIASGVPLCIEF